MAELERSIIRERVVAGLEHAQWNGTRSGLAVVRPKVIFDRDLAIQLREQGLLWRQIARKLDVRVTTVRRVCSDHMLTD